MRGCFVSLLLWLAGGALAVGAFLAFLHYRQGVALQDAIGPSIFAGILAWLSLNLFRAAFSSWRERAALARGIAGESPADGQPFVFVGTLEPQTAEILQAPFDGAPCLAYDYAITEIRGQGKRRTVINYYRGSALAPSAVATPSGTYPLLAVPEFQGTAAPIAAAKALGPFLKYAEATQFRSHKTSAQELGERWNDADGSWRSDVAYGDAPQPDLSDATFRQHHVEPGGKVTVFGHYAAGRGIVPHGNWANTTRLLAGDTEHAARTLRSQIRTRLLLALAFAAAAAGVALLVVPA